MDVIEDMLFLTNNFSAHENSNRHKTFTNNIDMLFI